MTDKKPVLVPFNPPDSEIQAPVPSILSGGFIDGMHKITGKNYNAFWREQFRSLDYLFQGVHRIYISTAGDDSTGTGEFATPYKTIGKALEYIAPNCFTYIIPIAAGVYEVDLDYNLENKMVRIFEGIAGCEIHFKGKDLGGLSSVYKLILENSYLEITATKVKMPDPVSGNWNDFAGTINYASGIYCIGMRNTVKITSSQIEFSSVTAVGFPALIFQDPVTSLDLVVYQLNPVVTNSKGYFIAYTSPALAPATFVSKSGATFPNIDDPNFFARNGQSALNQSLKASFTPAGAWRFSDGAGRFNDTPLSTTATDSDIKTEIENFIMRYTGISGVICYVVTERTGLVINSVEISLGGTMSAKKVPFPLWIFDGGLVDEIAMYQTVEPKKANGNIIGNFHF